MIPANESRVCLSNHFSDQICVVENCHSHRAHKRQLDRFTGYAAHKQLYFTSCSTSVMTPSEPGPAKYCTCAHSCSHCHHHNLKFEHSKINRPPPIYVFFYHLLDGEAFSIEIKQNEYSVYALNNHYLHYERRKKK